MLAFQMIWIRLAKGSLFRHLVKGTCFSNSLLGHFSHCVNTAKSTYIDMNRQDSHFEMAAVYIKRYTDGHGSPRLELQHWES
jgi:phosphoketolase